MHLARLASLIFDQPHYITPRAADAIVRALDGKLGPITIEANGFIGDEQVEMTPSGYAKRKGYRMTPSGVAIVSLQGELVNRGAWVNAASGLVSYEGIRQQIRLVRDDPKVKAVLFDWNSPGGMAAGMSETAAELRALAQVKPVVSLADNMLCSAAYGVACGGRIVTTQFGYVGSIGTVMIHADRSGELAQKGIRVTMIHKGARKVDGNPFEPLPKDVADRYDAEASRFYDDFVATVAAGRKNLKPEAIRATEAAVYLGPDAVAAGLADAVGTFESALADLEQQIAAATTAPKPAASAPRSSAPTAKGATMTEKTHTQADVDAARAEGLQAGATAERERVKAIIMSPEAQANPALAAHYAYNTADDAPKAIAAMKAAGPAVKPEAAKAATEPTVMGLELASPAPAANAKPKAVIDTAAIYARRRA